MISHPHQSIGSSKSFVSNDAAIVVGARFRYMPLDLKMATPQRMSWCVLQLMKSL
jgi:hypothetical protein